MKKELCEITRYLLEQHSYALGLLRGEYHNDNKSQSCENWLQVEIAQKLTNENQKVEIEARSGNHDIFFTRNGNNIAVEIKIDGSTQGMKRDVEKLIRSIEDDVIQEGYLLFIMVLKEILQENPEKALLERASVGWMSSEIKEQIRPLWINENPHIGVSCIKLSKDDILGKCINL